MAASDVSIANRALQKLGARQIASLTEDSPNARSVSIAYEPVRDRLLREYEWNFAIKRASVAADATETLWGGLNRFRKPNDFLRLLRDTEAGSTTRSDRQTWRVEGEFIVTSDGAPLEFRYLARIEDPVKFDPLFSELFSLTLAAEMIGDIETSITRKQIILDEMTEVKQRARHANSLENDAREAPQDSWLDARL